MCYVLYVMRYVLCVMRYMLCVIYYVYVLYVMCHHVLCMIMYYVKACII